MSTQGQNCLTTNFSEHITVVKWHMTTLSNLIHILLYFFKSQQGLSWWEDYGTFFYFFVITLELLKLLTSPISPQKTKIIFITMYLFSLRMFMIFFQFKYTWVQSYIKLCSLEVSSKQYILWNHCISMTELFYT